jgi:hypothetical protein
MHFDRRNVETLEQLDFQLLRTSPINLYWRPIIFETHRDWLADHGYRVESFDAAVWQAPGDEQTSTATALQFPTTDYSRGGNWDSWRDWLLDLEWIQEDLLAVAFSRFDLLLARDERRAHTLLEILAEASRHHLLLGRHLVILVQTDDSSARVDNLDPVFAKWNHQECFGECRWEGPPPNEMPPPLRLGRG